MIEWELLKENKNKKKEKEDGLARYELRIIIKK